METESLLSLYESSRKPVKTLVETVSGRRATGLDVPLAVRRAESVQSEFVSHFSGAHGVWQILLVGENEQDGIAELVLVQHSVQFVSGGIDTIGIIGIDDEDQSLRVLVVVTPQRTDLVLTTDIPHCKRDVLVFDGFDVEADGWDRRDDFSEFQLVEDGGFTGGIKTNHKDAHLLLSEHALPHAGECKTHGGCLFVRCLLPLLLPRLLQQVM
mmetsp:Transcript_14053/g.40058  ORF Transcript_14053/g.40058 Transcript_14053/m.40058 type:complete len:212 (-) Transcript_14053:65-700(-)